MFAKKLSSFSFMLPALLILAGCSTSYLSQPSSPLEVRSVAQVEPIIQVGEQIEATASVSRVCYMFIVSDTKFADGVNYGGPYVEESVSDSFWGDTILEAKSAAAYKACAENKADVILCPRYYVTVKTYPFYKVTRAKVFGYKGTITGVKLPEIKPLPTQPVKIVDGVKISDKVDIAQPLKVSVDPVEISKPVQIAQPISVMTVTDTQR